MKKIGNKSTYILYTEYKDIKITSLGIITSLLIKLPLKNMHVRNTQGIEKNFVLIYIYIFFSQKRGENNTNGNHLIQNSSLLKDRKSWSRKSENLAKKEADRKQRRKITIAGAGSTSGSVCIYCGHRSVSKAYSPERNRCRREKEGLRAKRKRKAFVAVGNERGIERRGRG